jgi:hypothetical protein
MTKCLTIGLSSFSAAIARPAAKHVSDVAYRSCAIDDEHDWYSEEDKRQPFEDNYIPGAPKQDRAWT